MKANDKRILTQAASWVDRASQPGMGVEDAAAFEHWMAENEAHRIAFAELAALWRSDALLQASMETTTRRPDRLRRPIFSGLAVPAGLAAAIGLLAVLFAPWMDYRTLETRRAETQSVALADNSTIRMSGDARLLVRQSPISRDVTLTRGEAFFDVRHDGRPFTVNVDGGWVRVTGTAFNIDRNAHGGAEITLYRGSVRVRAKSGETLDLKPGDRILLERGVIRRLPAVSVSQPDWLDGWFDTEAATMEQLAEEIGRFSRKPIVVEGSARLTPIAGRFRVSEPAVALELISNAYGVEVQEKPDRILITNSTDADGVVKTSQ